MPTAPPDWSCSFSARRLIVFGVVSTATTSIGASAVPPIISAASSTAALESVRRVGLDAEAARGAADDRGLEPRALEEDVLRRRGDLALRAADDAAEADGFVGVGDDAGVLVKLAHFVVEAAHRFAGLAFADDDRIALQAIEVEGMQRVAEGEHHVVRGVDDVVDRAEADGFESRGDFCGAPLV